MRKFIIDTDTASDDAMALIMALREPSVHIEAITTVNGNVPLKYCNFNARLSVEIAGTYCPPIFAGCDHPLVKEPKYATAHGLNGLSDLTFDEPSVPLEKEHAVNALIRLFENSDGDIGLITLGPLTNIALALRKAPHIAAKIPHIYIMGGTGLSRDAHTMTAEFNIFVDPEAASVVFESGIPNTVIPLQACYGEAAFDKDDLNKLAAIGKLGKFCVDTNQKLIELNQRNYQTPIASFADPSAMAVVLKPDLVTAKRQLKVRVDIMPTLSYGQTVQDGKASPEESNTTWVDSINATAFKEYIYQLMTV